MHVRFDSQGPLLRVLEDRRRARAWSHRGAADGVLFEGSGAHSLGMSQTLDVALLDGEDRVLWLGRLRPWRMVNHPDACWVVELPEGSLADLGWECGQVLARTSARDPTEA